LGTSRAAEKRPRAAWKAAEGVFLQTGTADLRGCASMVPQSCCFLRRARPFAVARGIGGFWWFWACARFHEFFRRNANDRDFFSPRPCFRLSLYSPAAPPRCPRSHPRGASSPEVRCRAVGGVAQGLQVLGARAVGHAGEAAVAQLLALGNVHGSDDLRVCEKARSSNHAPRARAAASRT